MAVQVLGAGAEFAYMARALYTRMLFLLSKAMLFLLGRKFSEANPILQQTGPLIEAWVQQNSHQRESVAKQQKEHLQIFFLVLQVCYYLMVGQVKSVKTVLKQLQQSIQTVTSAGWPADEEMVPANVADNFQWLSKDHLCILVYLVTVMHSMQAGYMDKAQKYTDKAITQIEKLRASYDSKPLLLSSFHVLLMEHIVQCRLVTGNKGGAIQVIDEKIFLKIRDIFHHEIMCLGTWSFVPTATIKSSSFHPPSSPAPHDAWPLRHEHERDGRRRETVQSCLEGKF